MANDQTQPRTALITGAGRRIGATIAFALSRAGYAVVLHANQSRAQAEKLAGEIMRAGGRALVVLADLADGEAVAKLVPVEKEKDDIFGFMKGKGTVEIKGDIVSPILTPEEWGDLY